jgi:membrane protein DedA with SNARE-associated domain
VTFAIDVVNAATSFPAPLVYLVILLWLAAESLAIPVPNEAILLAGGFLAGLGHVNLTVAWLAAVAGSLSGATLARWIARRYGRAGVERVGRYVYLTPSRLGTAETFFRSRGGPAIFAARLVPVVRIVISYVAGLADMSYRPFAIATVLGAATWNLTMLLLGRAVGEHWLQLFKHADRLLVGTGGVVIAAVVGYLVVEHLVKRRWAPTAADPEPASNAVD